MAAFALDPRIRALLDGPLKAPEPAPPLTVSGARARADAITRLLAGPCEPVFRIRNESIRGVPVRWYEPTPEPRGGPIVYVHGGGWVTGTLDSYDALCAGLARRSGRNVVSAGYSLSPEAVFPQPVDEVVAVLHALSPYAVAGDSCGGHLAAAAVHVLAESGRTLPEAMVLIYPVVDRAMTYASYRKFAEGYFFTTARMRWFWDQFLGGASGSEDDPRVSPIRSPHLARFPRTLVITAECDILHDDGKAFAEALRSAGVRTDYWEAPGYVHGFLRFRRALNGSEWSPDSMLSRVSAWLDAVKS